MKSSLTLETKRIRHTFYVVYVLSALMPILILLYILNTYVYPELSNVQVDRLLTVLTIGLTAMLVIPLLGFAQLWRWIKSLEDLTKEVKQKTLELTGHDDCGDPENEMEAIKYHFQGIYSELQDKMLKLSQYSQRLIDDNIKLKEQAITDELTTLFNRRYFDLRISEEASRATRYGFEMTLIMIDVDGFKAYNDQYGHPAGDDVLRDIGRTIKNHLRKSDLPFRYGGDEFAVILPQCNITDAVGISKKMIHYVKESLSQNSLDQTGSVSISCGVAKYSGDAKLLVELADKCLYKAKLSGKGRVVSTSAKSIPKNTKAG